MQYSQAQLLQPKAQPMLPIAGRQAFATIMLIINAVGYVILTFFLVEMMDSVLSDPEYGYFTSEMEDDYMDKVIRLGVVEGVMNILTVTAFCMWAHRAMTNVHRYGLYNIEYTAGWTVGWFFIPVATYFKPAQAMRQVFLGSKAINGQTPAHEWKNGSGGSIIVWWFVIWTIGRIYGVITGQVDALSEDIDSFTISFGIEIFINLIAAVLCIVMIRQISHMQKHPVYHQYGEGHVGGYYPETHTSPGYRPEPGMKQNYTSPTYQAPPTPQAPAAGDSPYRPAGNVVSPYSQLNDMKQKAEPPSSPPEIKPPTGVDPQTPPSGKDEGPDDNSRFMPPTNPES